MYLYNSLFIFWKKNIYIFIFQSTSSFCAIYNGNTNKKHVNILRYKQIAKHLNPLYINAFLKCVIVYTWFSYLIQCEKLKYKIKKLSIVTPPKPWNHYKNKWPQSKIENPKIIKFDMFKTIGKLKNKFPENSIETQL